MFFALALFADALRLWMGPALPSPTVVQSPPALPRWVARDVRDACTSAERREGQLTRAQGAQILMEEGPWTRLK